MRTFCFIEAGFLYDMLFSCSIPAVLVQLTAIIGLLVVQTEGFPRPSLSPAPNADQCFAKRKAIEGLLPFSRRLSGEIYTVHSNVVSRFFYQVFMIAF